jgi:Beta-propeller repeat
MKMKRIRSLILALSTAALFATTATAAGVKPSTAALETTYSKLPMSFERNAGQSRSGVDFIARGSGYSVLLASSEAVLVVKTHKPLDRDESVATIHMALVGSAPARGVVGEDELPGKANYFVGHDPGQWHRDVPTFAKVRYSRVYPGIDVVYYGNQGRLEYDFIVSPGADPSAIVLGLSGAAAEINKDGDLVLALAGATTSMRRPYIYQDVAGKQHAIAGGYVKRPDGRIGFSLGSYDTTRPLVIDPVLLYSTLIGGSGSDNAANAIAIDKSGNAYITGQTTSLDFPTQHAMQGTSGALFDAYVAKIDPSGSTLIYSTYFGGDGDDVGSGIAVDASGQAYITGKTTSSNFPATPGAYGTAYSGYTDAFVAKFNSTGSALIYSTYLGGSGYDVATGIAIDPSGNAYISGFNYAHGFPTTPGAYQPSSNGPYDAFVTKLNPTGSALVFSTYIGGTGDDYGTGIGIDSNLNVYVVGQTNSGDFPMQNATQPIFGGYYDAFVAKLNPAGSSLIYSTYLGGDDWEAGFAIAVDAPGNAYVTGLTGSSHFPTTPGAFQITYGGNGDAFVAKINPSGSLAYSTYLGGVGGERALAIAVDQAGSAYVTGYNLNADYPQKDAMQANLNPASFESFVTKLAPDGGSLVYSTYLGGIGNDLGLGIAVDLLGSVYVSGVSQSPDFPTTVGAFQETNTAGVYEGFVVKIAAPSVGKITGGGSISAAGNTGTFGFTVQRTSLGAPIQGDLQYVNHGTGAKIHSVSFSSFSVTATTATFAGTCVNNGVACTFSVSATDNGEPGDNDTFSISISGAPAEGGVLHSGNIQIH